MILVIDNYDSFTYNLVQYLGELGGELRVVRNDAVDADGVAALRPERIVISPGPGTPDDAGVSLEVIRRLGEHTPILGVCLGHQAIGQAFGGTVARAKTQMHGKTDVITTASESITARGLQDSAARLCRSGSVIVVVRSGILKHMLPIGVLATEAAINQDIKCFDSGDDDLNRWLALAWRACTPTLLAENREGTTVQSVKLDTLTGFTLAVPPVAEQRCINVAVRELLARIATAAWIGPRPSSGRPTSASRTDRLFRLRARSGRKDSGSAMASFR